MAENLRVLIVDDMRTTREMLAETLRSLGVTELRTTANGIEALAALDDGDIDLVISDLHMPDMDGLELYRQMKRTGRVERTQFALCTGDDALGTLPDGYRLGGHRMIKKPVRTEALMDCLDEAIARSNRGIIAHSNARRLPG